MTADHLQNSLDSSDSTISTESVLEHSPETAKKLSDFLTRDEIKSLTERSDAMGLWAIGSTWAVIAGGFAALAWAHRQPRLSVKVTVIPAAMAVIAGRQLCLAILMHDAAHGTLFKTRSFNERLGEWLCARPIWNDMQRYRVHHREHHLHTNQDGDTDRSLSAPFPVTRPSLARKFARDLIGLTGAKFLLGRLLQDAGYHRWTVANEVTPLPQDGRSGLDPLLSAAQRMWPMLLTNAALYGGLRLVGQGALYPYWVAAYLTPFPLFLRIRSMAEHAGRESSSNMFRNTRTLKAGWLARTLVAPIHVNFHIEHHVMASVPWFRLPQFHRILQERQLAEPPVRYFDMLRELSSKSPIITEPTTPAAA